jgi:hypothetical protein
MFPFLDAQLTLLFTLLLEVTQSPSNGLVTTMLVDLSDLPGLLPLALIATLLSIPTFKRSAATKLEAASQMMPAILMEETQDPVTDLPEPALTPSLSPLILLTDNGLFNGPGLEEPSLSEITTRASIIASLEELLALPLFPSS